jgi:hypothetical protein
MSVAATAAQSAEPPSRSIALFIGLVAATALIVHARSYPLLTYDDAFISLRYAQRLLEGQGLSWTEGPPVEGYSNLLWVLACALLAALGFDLVDTPVILGIGSAIATIAALIHAFPPRSWSTSLPALAGSMFIALAGPIGLWAVTGLEGCLVAALLAWALVFLRPLLEADTLDWRATIRPGIPLALLCLSRPDGPLLVVAVCAYFLLRARSRDARLGAIAIGVLPGLVTLGQIGFRLAYYGDWLPNTARAKVAFTVARVDSGLQCVASAGLSSWALWVPAGLAFYAAWRAPTRRSRILLGGFLLLVWTAYTASVSCQPFGYRMLIPAFVLLAFLVADALDWIQWQGRVARGTAWALTMALLFVFARAQQGDKNIAMAHWRMPPVTVSAATIGNTLREAFEDDDPLVAVDAAGAIPFYSELRSVDMLGLNDAHIARHHDESFGQGVQGHELGDGAYVLSREPDIIVASVLGSSRLAFRGGHEMDADPRFHELYRRVRVRGDDPVTVRFNIFCRIDGRVGMQRSERLVTIPGYFFASTQGTQARLDADQRLGTHFLAAATGMLEGVELPAGTWRFSPVGTDTLRASARRESDGLEGSQREQGAELSLDAPARVTLSVSGTPPAVLIEVRAERIGD